MSVVGKTHPPTEVDEWMSLADAARVLGESRQGVLTRAVKGDIVAKHIAGRTVVTRESVERVRSAKAVAT